MPVEKLARNILYLGMNDMYLKDIEQVRNVQWGKTYLWDIKFIGGGVPDPFNEWFPAVNVEDSDGAINSFQFEGGNTMFKTPQNKSNQDIKLTFVDKDFEHGEKVYNLYEWMIAWRNQSVIKPDGTVGVLSEIVKHIVIAKMNSKKEIVRTSSYWVYPEGEIAFVGNSENGVPTYNVSLVVVAKD